jgi:hypothetical protein
MALFRSKVKEAWTVAAILVCAVVSDATGQSSTPSGTIRSVLHYEQRHDNARDSSFNKRNLKIYRRWITPSLHRLFLSELAREEQEARSHPDEKPYLGDGMQFGPIKEYCKENNRVYRQQFSLRKAIVSGSSAIVPASFFYNRACGGGKPTVYRFKLVRRSSVWLIDDIDYGQNGTLRQVLRRIEQ